MLSLPTPALLVLLLPLIILLLVINVVPGTEVVVVVVVVLLLTILSVVNGMGTEDVETIVGVLVTFLELVVVAMVVVGLEETTFTDMDVAIDVGSLTLGDWLLLFLLVLSITPLLSPVPFPQ